LASALFATQAAAQVVDFGKYPAFKGQWFRTGPPNNWHQVAGLPPYTPEAQKKWEAIQDDLKTGGPGNWQPIGSGLLAPGAVWRIFQPIHVNALGTSSAASA
jgi:hypothetical protein